MRTYYVVYNFTKEDGSNGIACSEFDRTYGIHTWQDILKITEVIAKNNKLKQVIILNWRRIYKHRFLWFSW